MKVVILAGGLGTRISEESHLKPKPMIEIGGRPILWHIMKYYSEFGFHDFVICLGYKQYVVKDSEPPCHWPQDARPAVRLLPWSAQHAD